MPNEKFNILWADDEIDLLKPHLMFLRGKGYNMLTATSGADAIEMVQSTPLDLVILDENMPGITGLETLSRIKLTHPELPVVMITKSEEENIMDQAVGNKIADYLIKPVNPNQILIAIKKILHSDTLVSQRATTDYRQDFTNIASEIGQASDFADWCSLYSKLVYWEMELASADTPMSEMLKMQHGEANLAFAKYIRRNYERWITPMGPADDAPLMSPRVFARRVLPLLDKDEKVFFIVIDNFRLDQWRAIKPLLSDVFSFLRTHAGSDCQNLPRNVGRRRLGRGQEPQRKPAGAVAARPIPPQALVSLHQNQRFIDNGTTSARLPPARKLRHQHSGSQLHRYALARAHRVENDTRARL